MPPRDQANPHPTRADVDARIGETFLTLNQIAASLALVERSCSRVVDGLPVDGDPALDHALALRDASTHARLALEKIGDVSDTLTTVLRFLAQQKARTAHERFSVAGECCGGT
jgi:hypothetical protein